MNMATLAGSFSTVIFVGSTFPMLVKAIRTRDLESYSRSQLVLANCGNVLNSLYVFSLPIGPIWILHIFNLASTLFMFVWHQRFAVGGEPLMGRPPRSWTARSEPDERGGARDDARLADGRDSACGRLG